MIQEEKHIQKGIFLGLNAYLIWGLLPIYWKFLETTRAEIVLGHRIIWSFIFMLIFILITNKTRVFIEECKKVWKNKKTLLTITIASMIISVNWLIFIWAVQTDRVVQASLGYYINPLMSVLLGVFVLKERLSRAQLLSVILAGIGVTYLTFSYGVFPWISLALAISFAVYGLLKKLVAVNSTFSLALVTMVIAPFTLILLVYSEGWDLGFSEITLDTGILLSLTGVATAIPLLLFGASVRPLSLSMAGFLKYIAPTIMLVLGGFLYEEDFTTAHLITFVLIWVSLIIFMTTSVLQNRRRIISRSKMM